MRIDKFHQWVQDFLFLGALLLTVLFQSHAYLAKVGWLLFALLSALNPVYAVYAAFFYSAFFTSSGFFPNFFFTLKHFHIVILLLILLHLIRGKMIRISREGLKLCEPWLFWLAIIFLSLGAGGMGQNGSRVFMTTMNMASLVFASALLILSISTPQMLVRSLIFLTLGTTIRLLLAMPFCKASPLHECLLYNNHLGFLASSTFMISACLVLKESHALKRLFFALCCIFIFFALVLTCSRTAWISIFITTLTALFLFRRMRRAGLLMGPFHADKIFFAKSLMILTVILSIEFLHNPSVFSRIVDFGRLSNFAYWQYTLQDHQNFGFLGYFRLQQFRTVKHILKAHPFFGIGFTREVTDIHSLYLTLLGGVGGVGLILFFIFALNWSSRLWGSMMRQDDGFNLYRLAIFLSFSIWILHSMMETYITQFNVWVLLVSGILLLRKSPWLSQSSRN